MAKINKVSKQLPTKSGWYWVLLDGYDNPTPCWYDSQGEYFLPAGLGDESRDGLYVDDIERVGPEIIEPTF